MPLDETCLVLFASWLLKVQTTKILIRWDVFSSVTLTARVMRCYCNNGRTSGKALLLHTSYTTHCADNVGLSPL